MIGCGHDRVHEAANLPECECDVDVRVERTFAGYRLAPGVPAVKVFWDSKSAVAILLLPGDNDS